MEINKEYLDKKLKAEQDKLEKLVKNHDGLQNMLKQTISQIGGSQDIIKAYNQMLVDIGKKAPEKKEVSNGQCKKEEKDKDTK